ncbi:hypothetical protein SEUCBS140593_001328 [Sporothrix eucalyptigena]|uniref:Uncharacterized protein n=1 Tax=Sporothrix eucalyptigena TaxID=1812306 RepID=A0ABP0AXA2_9PEZI
MPFQNITPDPPGSTRDYGEFFSYFKTYYGGESPYDTIKEINNKSADINFGQGGEYVWIVPHRASSPRTMVDNIWVDIRGSKDGGRNDDLAKGAGGNYRYLSWSNDMGASHYITDVALWRSGDAQSNPPSGWHHKSDDINKGRGGDYLYLVWRTKQYCGEK